MYIFQILAYEAELNNPDMPGVLSKATEIVLIANGAAEALERARKLYISPKYFIKRIEQVNEQKMLPVAKKVVRDTRRAKT